MARTAILDLIDDPASTTRHLKRRDRRAADALGKIGRSVIETGVKAEKIEALVSGTQDNLLKLAGQLESLIANIADANERLRKIEQRQAAELNQAVSEAGALRRAGHMPQ